MAVLVLGHLAVTPSLGTQPAADADWVLELDPRHARCVFIARPWMASVSEPQATLSRRVGISAHQAVELSNKAARWPKIWPV